MKILKFILCFFLLYCCKDKQYYPIYLNYRSDLPIKQEINTLIEEKIKWAIYEDFSDGFVLNNDTLISILNLKVAIDTLIFFDSMAIVKYGKEYEYYFRNEKPKDCVAVNLQWRYHKPLTNISKKSKLVTYVCLDTVGFKTVIYSNHCFQCGTGQGRTISIYEIPVTGRKYFKQNLQKNKNTLDDWVYSKAIKMGLLN